MRVYCDMENLNVRARMNAYAESVFFLCVTRSKLGGAAEYVYARKDAHPLCVCEA